jgi:ABC-type branched-subunit amino acid transport system permease subunit
MRRGQGSAAVWDRFDRMFAAVGALEPDTTRRQVLMPEIWARTNELLKQRRTRLHASDSEVPLTLWLVVLIGTALTIGSMFVLPPTRFSFAMIGMVAVSSALVFHIIAAMDRPFAGEESVSSAPFESAIENMKRWDSEIVKQPAIESASR